MKYRCQICQKIVSVGFYFCNDCAKEYGMADANGKFYKPREWPDWAREMYNDEKRRRRRVDKEMEKESDLEWDDEFGGVK